MNAGIFIDAVRLASLDLFAGFLAGLAVAILLALAAVIRQEEERERPEPVDPIDFAEEIRVHDLTRRGPERVADASERSAA